MTSTDILVIAIGAPAGYWLVSFLLKGIGPKASPQKETPSSEPGSHRDESDDGFHDRSSSEGRQQPAGDSPWYEVLEIAPDASAREIRSAYRQLISQYHPDKVDSLGKELKELANRKSREIMQAYRTGLAMRGETD